MLEVLIPVATAALLGSIGWTVARGATVIIGSVKDSVKFRTTLSIGLETIAKELSQFRSDVNDAMKEEQAAHIIERSEYRQIHHDLDKRISLTEALLARHDERISSVEDRIKNTSK